MAAVGSVRAVKLPIPPDIAKYHHRPESIWMASPELSKRAKTVPVVDGVRYCEVQRTDPDWGFVMKLFNEDKPAGMGIRKITRAFNTGLVQSFEGGLANMEREAPTLLPAWQKEEPMTLRKKVMDRFESLVRRFPPVVVHTEDGRKELKHVFSLPLWHGTAHWRLILSNGFKRFGKHRFDDSSAPEGAQKSTDEGWLGDGLYFTDTPRYALLYNKANLVLTVVSGRWPYPVVSDKPFPEEGTDMGRFKGRGLYQNYNTHFGAMASVVPGDPENMVYHPCDAVQEPSCDEFVVSQEYQALPCFHIETGLELTKPVAPQIPTRASLYQKLLTLLDNPEVRADENLHRLFSEMIGDLGYNLQQKPSPKEIAMDHWIGQLFQVNGKINAVSKQKLLESQGFNVKKEEKKGALPAKIFGLPLGMGMKNGHWDVSDKYTLLKVAKAHPEREDCDEENGLLIIARLGTPSDLQLVLKTHPQLVNTVNKKGNSALHIVAACGASKRVVMASTLLGAGIDITIRNKERLTALEVAQRRGDEFFVTILTPFVTEKTKELAEKAKVLAEKAKEKEDQAIRENLAMGFSPGGLWADDDIPSLLKIVKAYPERRDKLGITGLHVLTRIGDPFTLQEAISIHGDLLESRTIQGETPLLTSLSQSSFLFRDEKIRKENCEVLIRAKANTRAVNNSGETALHLSTFHGVPGVMELLLARDKGLVKIRDNKENTALHSLIYNRNKWSHERLTDACELLICAGVDTKATNKHGVTALQVLTRLKFPNGKDREIIELLRSASEDKCIIQ